MLIVILIFPLNFLSEFSRLRVSSKKLKRNRSILCLISCEPLHYFNSYILYYLQEVQYELTLTDVKDEGDIAVFSLPENPGSHDKQVIMNYKFQERRCNHSKLIVTFNY